jgi:hypothetical protein
VRLPAFGRALLGERLEGRHPHRVWVLYGDDWDRRPVGQAVLCVGSDWTPGRTDWLPVAGVLVHLVDRGGLHLEALAAELAEQAAPVVVHWREAEGSRVQAIQEDVSDLAFAARRAGPEGYVWPAWWSEAQEQDYQARKREWLDAALADARATVEGQVA